MGVAAKLIREARQSAGLTLAELAELAGSSKPTISRYENSLVDPGAETLSRLLRACGYQLRSASIELPHTMDEIAARFQDQPAPTADDVTRTADGRELRTAEQVANFIAELRNAGLLAG